jgi:hypothetical protein
MPTFLWIDRHAPEECEVEYAEWEEVKKQGVPPIFKGVVDLCPCPYGEHAGYMELEAESPDEILSLLPPVTRKNSRVVQIDRLPLD